MHCIFIIALAHNGKQNGDVMSDPDVQIWIHPDHKEAEAMTFQNDYLGIFQEVYPEPGKYRPKLKEDLNEFLLLAEDYHRSTKISIS